MPYNRDEFKRRLYAVTPAPPAQRAGFVMAGHRRDPRFQAIDQLVAVLDAAHPGQAAVTAVLQAVARITPDMVITVSQPLDYLIGNLGTPGHRGSGAGGQAHEATMLSAAGRGASSPMYLSDSPNGKVQQVS